MAWPASYDNLPHVHSGDTVTATIVNNQSNALNALEATIGVGAPNGYSTVAAAIAALAQLPPRIVTGTVYCFAGTTAPSGYLLCDGSSVSQTTYAALFGVIGLTYGGGSGNFNLPDLRGRVPMGAGTGSGLTPRVLAANGGEDTHVLSTQEMPVHTHSYNTSTPFLVAGTIPNQAAGTGVPPGGATQTVPTTTTVGSGSAHANLQPYLTLNYIIKT